MNNELFPRLMMVSIQATPTVRALVSVCEEVFGFQKGAYFLRLKAPSKAVYRRLLKHQKSIVKALYDTYTPAYMWGEPKLLTGVEFVWGENLREVSTYIPFDVYRYWFQSSVSSDLVDYRYKLHQSDDPTCLVRIDGRIVDCNYAFSRMFDSRIGDDAIAVHPNRDVYLHLLRRTGEVSKFPSSTISVTNSLFRYRKEEIPVEINGKLLFSLSDDQFFIFSEIVPVKRAAFTPAF